MNIFQSISSQLNLNVDKVSATIELLDAGNTLPFIARYRKEVTGSLDEDQIWSIQELLENLRLLEARRETVLSTISGLGKLTPELEAQIRTTTNRSILEDLYLPFKPKRRTRASIARDKGLEGLAVQILEQSQTFRTLDEIVKPYLSVDVPKPEDAWAGARDIAAEIIADHPQVRQRLKEKTLRWGTLKSTLIVESEDPRQVFGLYYDFESRIDLIRPHQILAIQRGENEKVLRVKIVVLEKDWLGVMGAVFPFNRKSLLVEQLSQVIQDSAERLLLPAIEREVRKLLRERAEVHAIGVFTSNLRSLLNQSPILGKVVLGIDPGFRTGCKVAVVDSTGLVLDTGTIFPHEPQKKWDNAVHELHRWVNRYSVSLISIGNGTASRETEKLVAELIQALPGLNYIITNEAGASVYSASPLARAELPSLDVSIRGAVSIARRVQDPLAELVKIDPKSIGIGLYQHDVDQTILEKALKGTVESVVNRVGVDVNTASPALLTYVAGIGPNLAEQIVLYREEHGRFSERKNLQKVPKLGPKAYEQAAGFLRIQNGTQPLDASAIHPESYPAAEKIMALTNITMDNSLPERQTAVEQFKGRVNINDLAGQIGIGTPTIRDILEQLVRPGRDPRLDFPAPLLRSDVLSIDDLEIGMHLSGTVRNVVDFGAFVDIGVKQDGLLHKSQQRPNMSLHVGDVIKVEILKVEVDRGRISLKLV